MILHLWKSGLSSLQTPLEEKEPLPNLIIIDGGKGQLSSVKSLDALELRGKLQYIGIANDWKNFYPEIRFHYI
jgi:excinuclease UvrABC nuclease subunit